LTDGARDHYRRCMLLDKVYRYSREGWTEDPLQLAPAPALATTPEVRPTPLPALGLDTLPTELHFVRSHFDVPVLDSAEWTLELGGAVQRPRSYSLTKLRERRTRTQVVVLECAGHRRNELRPSTVGLQWGVGAVSEATWTGIALSELLREVSPTDG